MQETKSKSYEMIDVNVHVFVNEINLPPKERSYTFLLCYMKEAQESGCSERTTIHMEFKSERWFPWLDYNLQKPSLLTDVLLYTVNYPHLSSSRRFILHFENLLPFLSITSTPLVFNKTLWTP